MDLSDIDRLNEEMDSFKKLFNADNDYVKLQRNLCFLAHRDIDNIATGNYADSVKKDMIFKINYKACEPNKIIYLNDLKNSAIGAIEKGLWLSYVWLWQRPPSDSIRITPTLYYVKVNSISINFSDSDYKKYRGGSDWDSDPGIKVQGNTDNVPWIVGNVPVNQQSFTIKWPRPDGKKLNFFVNINKGPIIVTIYDTDDGLIGKLGDTLSAEYTADLFSKTSSSFANFENGTKVTLEWTSE